MRSQGLLLPLGLGVGVGAAEALAANTTSVACVAAKRATRDLGRNKGLPGISEASEPIDRTGDLVCAGCPVVAAHGGRAALLGMSDGLPVAIDPPQFHGDGEPAVGNWLGRALTRQANQARTPDLDSRLVCA